MGPVAEVISSSYCEAQQVMPATMLRLLCVNVHGLTSHHFEATVASSTESLIRFATENCSFPRRARSTKSAGAFRGERGGGYQAAPRFYWILKWGRCAAVQGTEKPQHDQDYH